MKPHIWDHTMGVFNTVWGMGLSMIFQQTLATVRMNNPKKSENYQKSIRYLTNNNNQQI
jgi:uncharacterized membrane protein